MLLNLRESRDKVVAIIDKQFYAFMSSFRKAANGPKRGSLRKTDIEEMLSFLGEQMTRLEKMMK